MTDPKVINKIFFDKYLCQRKIGKGSFGTVYEGINIKSNERVAFKLEKKEKGKSGTLETEAYRLLYLQGEGVPKIYCYGNNSSYNILVQELLGDSLDTLFSKSYKKFSLKTICVLGIEMINRIKWVHYKHHIHRDIKPDNFTIGREHNANKIYIIDFGLSKKYFSDSKQKHIKFCKGKSLTGTARYCGRHAHMGYEQSRRDDIESIGYVLMYFLLGQLPWQGLKVKAGEDHFDVIARKKIHTPFEELCKGQHEEFLHYFRHCDKLEFEEEPNYEYLIGLFQSMINKHCVDCTYDFDWNKLQCNYLPTGSQSQSQSTIDDKMNKSRDISLFVNKNNNTSAISVESTSKGVKENKEVFLNETQGANISFDGLNNTNPMEKSKTYRNRNERRPNRLEITIEEDDEENSHKKKRPITTRHGMNKKKKNKSRSVPKNYNNEDIHDPNLKQSFVNEHEEEKKEENIRTNNVEEHLKEEQHNHIQKNHIEEKPLKEEYNHKTDKEKTQNETNPQGEIEHEINQNKRKKKRSNSDDLNKNNGNEKDRTACGCIIL
ncbi:MAG: casein kinase 1 family protein [archaeon]|nr:casein kinase 1 family protein [archaeon]